MYNNFLNPYDMSWNYIILQDLYNTGRQGWLTLFNFINLTQHVYKVCVGNTYKGRTIHSNKKLQSYTHYDSIIEEAFASEFLENIREMLSNY